MVESVEEVVDENGQAVDWQYDPNEPRYCLCNQVSYGDMVGCDNDDVSVDHNFLFVSVEIISNHCYNNKFYLLS